MLFVFDVYLYTNFNVISTFFRTVYLLKMTIPWEFPGLIECLHVFIEIMKNTEQIGQNRNLAMSTIVKNPFKLVIESSGSDEVVIFFPHSGSGQTFFSLESYWSRKEENEICK